ncbi:MAG: cupin domain-containing protein [Selenomonadaceae bacterium]|nr:cupin domain-containing protein [Selenomonadaceae bacterium]
MKIILLSGGSGQRLWPLSNDVYSKQFLKIFKDEECMLQRVLKQIRRTCAEAIVTIATAKKQVTLLKKYLGDNFDLSVEPCRRNTFPSIALAAAYLHDIKRICANENIIICPVDPYVDDNFFAQFLLLVEQISDNAPLILMGIEPIYPSEKYGYIIPDTNDKISRVKMFKEKPNLIDAQKFIDAGGLWNGGVFAFKLSYILDKAQKLLGTSSHAELKENYDALPNISFDYAVVEHEKNIKVVRYVGEWRDIGTWNTLTEVLESNFIGQVQSDKTCRNLHVINSSDVPIICMGLKDAVVAASPEGILVSDKVSSSFIKPFVENLDKQIRFAEKSWGTFKIIDADEKSLTIKVTLNRGSRMKYHSHERRNEVWNFIAGSGRIIIDGEEKFVRAGDSVKIPVSCKHTVIADELMKIIEVQFGEDITVEDKIIWQEMI